MEKRLAMEGIFEKLEVNSFDQSENQMKDLLKNKFTLNGKKSFNCQRYLKHGKNWFPLARKFVYTIQNEGFASKLCFHQTRKNLSVAKMSEKQIKKWFPLATKSFFPNQNAGLA